MPKKKPEQALGRQAQKTLRTRQNLINATISLIKEGGFAAASSSRIAQRAGMTWGAAQHHYGSKEEILDAILGMSYEAFVTGLSAPALRQGGMEQRVSAFVDRMWAHYQSDLYLVALEILLATREQDHHADRAWEARQGKAHLKLARAVFHDSKLGDARLQEALTFTHCCLTGLSLEGIFESQVRHLPRHLQRIKQALLGMLTAAA